MAGNRDNVKDASGLLKLSNDINTAAGKFQTELDSLDRLIASFTEVWEGDVKDAFDQKYHEKYQKNIKEIISALQDYHRTSKSVAETAISRIGEGQSKFNAL